MDRQGIAYTLIPELHDCIFVPNFYGGEGQTAPTIAQIHEEVQFMGEIKSRGRPQPRRKCVLYNPDPRGVPFYGNINRCCLDSGFLFVLVGGYVGSTAGHVHAKPLIPEHPVTYGLWQRLLPLDGDLNHIIATSYINEEKNISAHADKTNDLVPGSFIYLLSTGPTRQMVFKKKIEKEKEEKEEKETRKKGSKKDFQRKQKGKGGMKKVKEDLVIKKLDLVNGSLFIMGPIANALFTHEVPKAKEACGERISQIVRAALTFKSETGMQQLRNTLAEQEERAAEKLELKNKKAAKKKKTAKTSGKKRARGGEQEEEVKTKKKK